MLFNYGSNINYYPTKSIGFIDFVRTFFIMSFSSGYYIGYEVITVMATKWEWN